MKASLDIIPGEELLFIYYQAFKGRLLNGLIHNIGSPLQSLMFFVEIMKMEDKFFRKLENLQSRLDSVYHDLNVIINTFNDFRMLDQLVDSMEKNLNFPDFFWLFSRVLKTDLFFKHNVSLEVRSNVRLAYLGVPSRIFVLIFVELVNNALKSLKRVEGSKRLVFYLEVPDEQERAIIGIGDSGYGWDSSHDVSILFHPLYFSWDPLKKGIYQEVPSFGLGLSCVRELCSKYEIDISLKRLDNMSWVRLTLPVYGVIF